MATPAPKLSRVRSFLFGALVLVWFSEMLFHGVEALSRPWAELWRVTVPADPQLATALLIGWSVAAPSKGALGVLAVYALLSRNPSLRTALFVPMALVPPLNLAFPMRDQGFLPGPVAVASVLSTILWMSFFLFKESSERRGPQEANSLSPWQTVLSAWFAVYSAAVTAMALLLLFRPGPALGLVLPCLSGALAAADSGSVSSLNDATLVGGTHMLAVAIACWTAAARGPRNPDLRRAVAAAGTAHAALFLLFPLRQIAQEVGGPCATSSILVAFVPLFVGWVLWTALSFRSRPSALISSAPRSSR